MRLPLSLPLPSSRTKWAMYKPDTALDGTVHDADTAQLPQSMSPVGGVEVSFRQSGCVCGSATVGCMSETTLRAPSSW